MVATPNSLLYKILIFGSLSRRDFGCDNYLSPFSVKIKDRNALQMKCKCL